MVDQFDYDAFTPKIAVVGVGGQGSNLVNRLFGYGIKQLERHKMTRFQTSVLRATLEIPRGEVRTYKQIAARIGHPNAYRAVGSALKKNPLAPMIPCHRVVKSSGELGNYSGRKGKAGKRMLLEMEGYIRKKN